MIIDLSPPIAIACDDIRQESSGKFILIGVYSGDLIVPSFPYTLTLSYLVLVKGSHVGDVKFQFDVTLNDKQVARILGEAELIARPPDYVLQLPVGAVPIQFDEACDLLLRCSFELFKFCLWTRLSARWRCR